MTVPPAALPGHSYPQAPVEYRPHPGHEHPQGCPNCKSGEHLVLSYPAVVLQPAAVYLVDSVTFPEVEPAGGGTTVVDPAARATKVACSNCRWSYTGPDPLARLVEATP